MMDQRVLHGTTIMKPTMLQHCQAQQEVGLRQPTTISLRCNLPSPMAEALMVSRLVLVWELQIYCPQTTITNTL